MPERIALKISEEAFDMIGQLVGGSVTDVYGDKTYAVITLIDLEDFELNVKFMSEDAVFEEVKNDADMHILSF